MSQSTVEWFKGWFNRDYLLVYGHRDEHSASKEIRALSTWTNIQIAHSALDLSCGSGRHLQPLAEYVHFVVGVDLSQVLLDVAAGALASGGEKNIALCNADHRHPPFAKESFDILLSLFTSFGYFEADADHLLALQAWYNLLKPGGTILLDCPNPCYVKKTFTPQSFRQEGNTTITESRLLHSNGSYIEKEIQISSDGTSRSYRERVRLFSPGELCTMLQNSGFSTLQLAGDYSGNKFCEESVRLIIFGQK